uniref:Uncharacterized protein n=1 Tax=Panagrolaimus sp. ES5 TaxID=591445 RepID=A0AC34FQH2_9BILA
MPTGDPFSGVGYHKVSSNNDSADMSRRSSVFSDLFTVLRKNTVAGRRKASVYHAPQPHHNDVELGGRGSVISSDLPLSPNAKQHEADMLGAAGPNAKENDEEQDDHGKPLTRQSLLDKIRQKKEVINKLRCQAWSHFGSVVSSYFTFLRWVIYMNIIITLLIMSFVTIPEFIADATADAGRLNRTATRKKIPESEKRQADEFQRGLYF